MKVSVALASVRHLYVDTAPLIYYVEENATYIARMDAVIDLIKHTPIQGVCSVITLVEVLPLPLHTGQLELMRDYRDILLNSREFVCLPINHQVAEVAADLRARYHLKTPDALHITCAITTGCDAFLTNDLGLKAVTEIKVIVLDELTA